MTGHLSGREAMTLNAQHGLKGMDWQERTRHAHSFESCNGWQYGKVWRFAPPGTDNPTMGPPAGDGWELNVDFPGGAVEEKPPRLVEGGRGDAVDALAASVPGCDTGYGAVCQ